MSGSAKFYISCIITTIVYGIYNTIIGWENFSDVHQRNIIAVLQVVGVAYLILTSFLLVTYVADYPEKWGYLKWFSPLHYLILMIININRLLNIIFD